MAAQTRTSTPRDSDDDGAPRESFRETSDSIVVAFILAFVFRAFVVEAFIIPTGSMAPTLYGRHGSMTCAYCGYPFAYGLLDPSSNSREQHGPQARALCPNCNRPNTNLVQNDKAGNSEAGDRILVLKWPLDIGGEALSTHRWEVTVFKDPADGVTNFIKRVVGMPGEVLSIIRGDVYTVPITELSNKTRDILLARVKKKTELQYQTRPGRLPPVPETVLRDLDRKLHITRKSPVAQKSLWFNVFDQDYLPANPVPHGPRWTAGTGGDPAWDTSSRTITFDGLGRSSESIELADAMTVDAYAYNLRNAGEARRRASYGQLPEFRALGSTVNYRFYGDDYVDDLRVRFVLEARAGGGAIRVHLTKLDTRLTAELRMDGAVSITARRGGKPVSGLERLTAHVPALTGRGRGVEVSFEVVDYRASLAIDQRVVLATTDREWSPDVAALRRGVRYKAVAPRIEADDASLALLHLTVERDVYYRDLGPSALSRKLGGWLDDTSAWGMPSNPIVLRAGEYFMLGDNSPQSQDSRLWQTIGPHLRDRGERFQLGTVPEDQLIGHAFFVYWPSGHRLGDWLPGLGKVGIIPNVGRMRWIR